MAALTQSKMFAAVPLAARRMLAARRVSDLWGLPAGLSLLCPPQRLTGGPLRCLQAMNVTTRAAFTLPPLPYPAVRGARSRTPT